jgi:tetratricopeptide (TPR) repeat protein
MAELRAEAALAARKIPEAREALLQALEHRPVERLWLRLAAVELELADVPGTGAAQRRAHLVSALEATRHALSQAPEGPALSQAIQISQHLAQSHMRAQDARLAETVAAKALLLSPRHPELALLLADARRALKRSDDVVAACREGLAGVTDWASPSHAALRWRLGRELRRLGRHTEALDELAAGLTEVAGAPKPLAAQMWYELAFVHAALDQREEALNAIRQNAELASFDPSRNARTQEVTTLEGKLAKAR